MPAPVRNRDRLIGIGEPVLPRYERIAFEKALVAPQGQPLAAFVCPGHPLLDAVDRPDARAPPRSAAARHGAGGRARPGHAAARALLPGARHPGREPHRARASAASSPSGMLYVELDADGTRAPPALRAVSRLPAAAEPTSRASTRSWRARSAPGSRASWSRRRRRTPSRTSCRSTSRRCAGAQARADRQDRGGGEGPAHQGDHLLGPPRRAAQAPGAGRQGQCPAQLRRGAQARRRAAGAARRSAWRSWSWKRQISPLPPVVLGGLLVVPAGLLAAMTGRPRSRRTVAARTRRPSAARARAIVMEIERELGFEPIDREFEKLGYDIESRVPGTGKLRFLEVKGRVAGADTITVTQERDPLLAQQARRLHPRHRRVPATTTRTASTTCAGRSSASRTSA